MQANVVGSRSFIKLRVIKQLHHRSGEQSPWRHEPMKAWWLLCQPSPPLKSATHLLSNDMQSTLATRHTNTCCNTACHHLWP